jgi:hypothetical protein
MKARAREAAARAKAERTAPLIWVQGLLCGALVAVAPPAALLLGGLLAPGLVTLLLDRAPGRPASRAILLFGTAGSLPALRQFWFSAQDLDAALGLLGTPAVLASAWLAAACGWLVLEMAPLGVRLALEQRDRLRAEALRAERTALAEEWGLPASGERE